MRPGGAPEAVLQDIVEPQSICEAPDGALWIVFPMHVIVWKTHTLNKIDRPNTVGISYDCAFDKHGDFWYSAHSGGLNRYRNGKWEEMFGPVESGALLPIEAGPSVPTTASFEVHWAGRAPRQHVVNVAGEMEGDDTLLAELADELSCSRSDARLALRDAALALTRASLLAGANDEDEEEDEEATNGEP